jgi:glycosyltransferase involved in cell wall biosynthesis
MPTSDASSLRAPLAPELSVVLPCYRSAALAGRSIARLSSFLEGTGHTYEIIVVDDGGGDFPREPWQPDGARLIRLPLNRGKGAAVAAGIRDAQGTVRVFTDVDLPYDLELIPVMASYILDRGFHVVIGDRNLPDSSYLAEQSIPRRMASALFSEFVGRLVTGGFFDTQCGLKAFRGDVAEELFRLQRLERFAFDVELVYLSLVHKLDIKRIPVQLRNNETSTVRLARDAARGFVDVFRIKYHRMRRHYSSPRLENIVRRDYCNVALGRQASTV